MTLCNETLTINPAEEAPVSIKNFLRIPPTFSFTVKNINATPNKKKTTPEMIIKRKPVSNSLNAGMKNTLAITTKTTTNAQNIDQLNFPFTLSHFPRIILALGIAISKAIMMNIQPVHTGSQVANSTPKPSPTRDLAAICMAK